MNKIQWFVMGAGLFALGAFLMSASNTFWYCGDDIYGSCFLKRAMYNMWGLIINSLGIIVFILGFLEKKQETKNK